MWWPIFGKNFIGGLGTRSRSSSGCWRRRQAERQWPWRRSSSMHFCQDQTEERGWRYPLPLIWRGLEVGSKMKFCRGSRGNRRDCFGTWPGKGAQGRRGRSPKLGAVMNGVEDPPRRSLRWRACGGRSWALRKCPGPRKERHWTGRATCSAGDTFATLRAPLQTARGRTKVWGAVLRALTHVWGCRCWREEDWSAWR